MSDTKTPTSPDYSSITSAYNATANTATQHANDSLNWAKDQVGKTQDLNAAVNKGLTDTQKLFTGASKDQLDQSKDWLGTAKSQLGKSTDQTNLANSQQKILNDTLDVSKGQVSRANELFDAAGNKRAVASGDIADSTGYLRNTRAKYNDPSRVASDMGASEAGVAQATEAARAAQTQQLESYGLNPGDVRFQGLDLSARLQAAAAKAAAGTTASRTDEAIANAANDKLLAQGNTGDTQAGSLTGQGTSVGNLANTTGNLALGAGSLSNNTATLSNNTGALANSTGTLANNTGALANTSAGTATNAGTAAVGNSNATTNSGSSALGTGVQWTGQNLSALSGETSAKNTSYTNQADADKAYNSASSGIGSALGTIAGLGTGGGSTVGGAALSSLGTAAMSFLAEGGAIPDGPVGGAIPVEASPSRGAITDDVRASGPSGPIRLNGGEFVIPKDVVQWEGEKSLQNLIMKARKAMEQAPAKPAVGGPQPQGARPAVG